MHDTKGQLKPDKEEVVVGCKDQELSTSVAGARTHDSNVLEAQQTLKNAVEQVRIILTDLYLVLLLCTPFAVK